MNSTASNLFKFYAFIILNAAICKVIALFQMKIFQQQNVP